MLFESLRNKIMTLPDDVVVYPAHGAGSACGKNMSKETFDTLGNQKKVNYALQNISKADFIKELTTGILPAPQYFAKNAFLNKKGYKNYSDVIESGSKGLSVEEFEEFIQNLNPIILDVRKADDYAEANIPGSLFIGLDGQFAPWVGTLISDINHPILLITPKGKEEETVMRLSRVGYDNCIGYLAGGMEAWINASKPIEAVATINADKFYTDNYKKGVETLDVRKPGEFDSAHLCKADAKPLDFIFDWIDSKNKSQPYMVHCAGGYRSMIAISILKANGYMNLTNVNGGFSAISKLSDVSTDIVTQACASAK